MRYPSSPELLRDALTGEREDFKTNIFMCGMLILAVLLIAAKTFFFSVIMVSGPSMLPTLSNNDLLWGNRVAAALGAYGRGSIVVVQTDREDNDTGEKVKIIKLIVGLPGDVIDISNGKVYVNGEELEESYLPEGTYTAAHVGETEFPFTVARGSIFVLGDNRSVSRDSRYSIYADIKKSQVYAVIPDWVVENVTRIQKIIYLSLPADNARNAAL
ncbi:MAG: signal peptidase I [Clostridia bacterium]|nr:signal peptidase I [Clostridia bacterium]